MVVVMLLLVMMVIVMDDDSDGDKEHTLCSTPKAWRYVNSVIISSSACVAAALPWNRFSLFSCCAISIAGPLRDTKVYILSAMAGSRPFCSTISFFTSSHGVCGELLALFEAKQRVRSVCMN